MYSIYMANAWKATQQIYICGRCLQICFTAKIVCVCVVSNCACKRFPYANSMLLISHDDVMYIIGVMMP